MPDHWQCLPVPDLLREQPPRRGLLRQGFHVAANIFHDLSYCREKHSCQLKSSLFISNIFQVVDPQGTILHSSWNPSKLAKSSLAEVKYPTVNGNTVTEIF